MFYISDILWINVWYLQNVSHLLFSNGIVTCGKLFYLWISPLNQTFSLKSESYGHLYEVPEKSVSLSLIKVSALTLIETLKFLLVIYLHRSGLNRGKFVFLSFYFLGKIDTGIAHELYVIRDSHIGSLYILGNGH